jgi:transglutaminase-like putative cysteine protease
MAPGTQGDSMQWGGEGTPDAEIFTVRSPTAAYWRATALDEYDGKIWRTEAQFEETDGALQLDPIPDGDDVRFEFAVGDLDKIWAPTAGRPRELIDPTVEFGWNEDLKTLIPQSKDDSLPGARYTLLATIPRLDPVVLRLAPKVAAGSSESSERTQLPPGLPERVRSTAAAVTEAQPNRYDAAVALQQFLRNGSFTYVEKSATAESDAGNRAALDGFLRDRQGSHELFASAFAVMARSVGIPARVVMGHLPGRLGEDGRHHVSRSDEHAWAEVWFEGVGWVQFDPTPRPGTTAEPF